MCFCSCLNNAKVLFDLTPPAIGIIYGRSIRLIDRGALHLVFGVIAVLMMMVNANQAGLPCFDTHPRVSRNGKHVGIVFPPFWAVARLCNLLGFIYALA